MAKTYTNIASFTAGQTLTAASMNEIGDTLDNHTVPPMCVVERAGQTGMTNTVKFAFSSAALIDTEAPTDPMHSTSTNNTRVTIRTAGVYQISAYVAYPTAPSNYPSTRLARSNLSKNGSAVQAGDSIPDDTYAGRINIIRVESCVVGDYYELDVNHTFGSGLTCTGRLQVVWIGKT